MKKAYSETWIENLYIQETSKEWLSQKLISSEQFEAIKNFFPQDFYRPNIWIRIALFLFTCMTCSFFVSCFSLFLLAFDSSHTIVAISLACSLIFFFALEFLIKDRKLLHSGIDNAMLYAVIIGLIIPVAILFEARLDVWQYAILLLLLLLPTVYRYADVFIAAIAYFTLLVFVGDLMMKFPLGKALLPFAIMFVSIAVYMVVKRIDSLYYSKCKNVISFLSLITFYLGGNYYIVREGNAMLNDLVSLVSPQIPFAPVFYIFTFFIPLAYLILGLRSKNRTVFLTGLLCMGFTAYTLTYYNQYLNGSEMVALYGVVMIALAAFGIHYFKTPKFGISDQQEKNHQRLLQIQAVITSQYLGSTAQQDGYQFGGSGEFSGGGAGTNY